MSDEIRLELDEQQEDICFELDGPPVPGKTGNGIASIIMNPDYTLTINYTDGTSYTTPSIRGEEGNGISNITVNSDYSLTIHMDDGSSYTTPPVRGPQGEDGVGIESIAKTGSSGLVDTYTITLTDGTTTTFTVTNGTDGQDGFSPTITVTNITGGHRLTITDKNGTRTVDVMDGAQGDPGDPGFSPTVTVVDITGGHRVTITDSTGSHSFDVMDGTDAHITVDSALSDTSENPVQNKVIKEEVDELIDDLNHKVDDVQVNGTSVVSQGVANVPIASVTDLGAVKINPSDGVGISSGSLFVNNAAADQVQAGLNRYRPLTPSIQHSSAFYGLAKAAGADMSSSSNPVGTYTDDAKVKIQKMLGVSQQGELIADVTATEDLTEFNITTDINGQPFKLTKMVVLFEAGPPTTGTRDSFYALAYYHLPNGDTTNYNFSIPSLQYPTTIVGMLARVEVDAIEGIPVIPKAVIATGAGNTQNMQSMARKEIAKDISGIRIYQSAADKSLIPSGSNIKIYGIRA